MYDHIEIEITKEGNLDCFNIVFKKTGHKYIKLPTIIMDGSEVVNKKEFIEAKLELSKLLNDTLKGINEINNSSCFFTTEKEKEYHKYMLLKLGKIEDAYIESLSVLNRLENNKELFMA